MCSTSHRRYHDLFYDDNGTMLPIPSEDYKIGDKCKQIALLADTLYKKFIPGKERLYIPKRQDLLNNDKAKYASHYNKYSELYNILSEFYKMGFSELNNIGNEMHNEPYPIEEGSEPAKVTVITSQHSRPVYIVTTSVPTPTNPAPPDFRMTLFGVTIAGMRHTNNEINGSSTTELLTNAMKYMSTLLTYAEEMNLC